MKVTFDKKNLIIFKFFDETSVTFEFACINCPKRLGISALPSLTDWSNWISGHRLVRCHNLIMKKDDCYRAKIKVHCFELTAKKYDSFSAEVIRVNYR